MADIVKDDWIQVNESDRDVDTQIDVKYGDRIVFSAEGEIWAGVWLTGRNNAGGWNNITYNRQFPLPGTNPYCLLGRLDGRYFRIGIGLDRFYRGRDSRLLLRINDDTPGNGEGSFFCHIQVYREATPREHMVVKSGPTPRGISEPVSPPELADFEKSEAH